MTKANHKVLKIISVTLSVIVLFVLLCVLAFNIVYIKTTVKGESMLPTINSDISSGCDRVFINKYVKGKTNDIIVADISKEPNWAHTDDGKYVIKRLVGTEGDRVKLVKIDDNNYELLVNGEVIYTKYYTSLFVNSYSVFENYVSANVLDTERIEDGAVIIKKGEIFILGDNWENSYDSSSVGPISKSSIVGKVDIIVSKNENIIWGAIKGLFKVIF